LVQILFLLFQGSCIPDNENKLQEDISTESHERKHFHRSTLRFCLFRDKDLTIQFQEAAAISFIREILSIDPCQKSILML